MRNMRYANAILAVAAALHAGWAIARSPAPAQNPNFCSSLKRIAAAAPAQFKGFDAGETRIGGGALLLPNTRESSATLPGVTGCRILTGNWVTHACYFPATSAAGVKAQASALSRTVGQCLGATMPRESMDGEYVLLTFQSSGLDYVVKVRPNTTIAVELDVRTSRPASR
jgi:hypothetical protein